jgi:3-hydroxyisobutyrate dehydrogenase-like beta-hydroxyacid dehydrogenase
MNIAFIGLGQMGTGIARNLLRAGHRVTAYNRTREKAEALAADGALVAASPADACRDADAAMTMLSDDAAVEQTVTAANGIAAALPASAAHLSCSTISTALARRLALVHAARGQGYLSTPVFGRPDAAEAKKLLVVAAGAPDLLQRFAPLFDAIGRQTFLAGAEPWQANAVKLCGNFMLASMLETFGEAFATLRKAGIDPHLFLDTMNALFASPVYAGYGRVIADQQFAPAGFAVPLGLKDVRLVLETAQECASPMPIASLVRDQLLSALAQGQAELDWASVSRVSARSAGLPG